MFVETLKFLGIVYREENPDNHEGNLGQKKDERVFTKPVIQLK